jgi:hypothetical protein
VRIVECAACTWVRAEAAETRMMRTEIRFRLVVATLREVAKLSDEAARVLHEVEK